VKRYIISLRAALNLQTISKLRTRYNFCEKQAGKQPPQRLVSLTNAGNISSKKPLCALRASVAALVAIGAPLVALIANRRAKPAS
jgi:hypothetical protein